MCENHEASYLEVVKKKKKFLISFEKEIRQNIPLQLLVKCDQSIKPLVSAWVEQSVHLSKNTVHNNAKQNA